MSINEWKGDRVLWFGDECPVPEQSSNDVIKTLYEQSAEFGYPGEWLGDIIGVSDQRPEGYSLINEIYVDW